MNLRIVGPTSMPDEVRQALSRQMINHRGAEFTAIFHDVNQRLKHYFQTEHEVLVAAASGTGGMEAAVVNSVSPGDKVLACVAGEFGERFANIAEIFGAEVVRLELEWGRAVRPEMVVEQLERHPETRVVLLTYNETSTGVTHPVAEIAAAIRSCSEALIVVDAISGLGAIDFQMDAWGVDIAITGSQKAWMIPPGLTMIGVNGRALDWSEEVRTPRYYWSFTKMKTGNDKDASPFTPAVGLFYGLQTALDLMDAEGREAIIARHQRIGEHTRQRVRQLGLELFAETDFASNTVTSILMPPGIAPGDVRRLMKDDSGVVVAGGQAHLKQKIVRIGHLGGCTQAELDEAVEALGSALTRLGWTNGSKDT